MGTDSVIYIRTDGNSRIATGHLVRCLCIAQALETFEKTVCFLVSDQDSESLLLDLSVSIFQGYSFSFEVMILKTAAYDNLEPELEELRALLINSSAISNECIPSTLCPDKMQCTKPIIFIDSYFVTQTYLDSLCEIAKVGYMDDLRAFDYHVDLIINYDVIPLSREMEYKKAYTNAEFTLLGAQFTPLRSQFQNQKVYLREKIQNILITTGGSDPYHFTQKVISYLLSQGCIAEFHVVIGRLFTGMETLEQLASRHPAIHLHYNVSDMAALMKQCDYAISAAGTTLYELCALGIPAVSFTFADNQMIMAETFAETKAIPYAGDIRPRASDCSNSHNSCTKNLLQTTKTDSPEISTVFNCIKQHLSSMVQSPSKRAAQHQLMRSLVDGNGAVKIAEALLKLL